MSLLSNLTVLSLEQATVLPFLTQRLARDGMRVIRVEPPGRGDPNRYVGRNILSEEGMASYFLPNNCGKQAITLNLAEAAGRAILHELIAKLPVDVFATNNRPSSYAKLGIDYETLKSIRPDIIWLGITGFGSDCDEAAYDPIVQARAGWMDLTGESDGPPLVFGLPMVDLGAAEHAYGALMKALYRRAVAPLSREAGEGSGVGAGCRIDISMLHSALAWMVSPLMLTALGERVTRHGNTHQFFAPVSVYPTRDGYAYVAVGNDRQWQALTGLPGFGSLVEPNYVHNAGRIADVERLNRRMADCTRTMATDELLADLNRIGVPAAKVNAISDVLADPRVCSSLALVCDDRTAIELALAPIAEVNGAARETLSFPPRLGEHNRMIYGEVLGYGAEQLAALKECGAI